MSPIGIDRGNSTLSSQMETLLRREIVRGDRTSGSRLNEVEIAEQYGVSRGPIREALQRLAYEGLVTIEPHRGAHVRVLTPEDVRNLFEVRIAVEVEAAGLAAARIEETGVELLEAMQDESGIAVKGEEEDAFPDVYDLHRLLASLARNTRLERVIAEINSELKLVRARSAATSERASQAVQEHGDVVARVVAGDVSGARRCMDTHLRAALGHTLRTVQLAAGGGPADNGSPNA